MHRSLASVYAFKSEIDSWQQSKRAPAATTISTRARSTVSELVENERESIAVLPFDHLGPSTENEYIADGLTEEVIAALSKVRTLRVISRTSTMALKETRKDARTIGGDLGVHFLLEGTVRSDQSRIRISVRLIDPATDDGVWSETYQGTIDEVFEIQEQIARKIVVALELHLSPEEDRRLASRSTDNVVVWRCVLQARQEALRWRDDSIRRAIEILHNGSDVVGPHADLFAAMSWAHLQYREAGIDLGEGPLDQAERYAARLFELDRLSPVGLGLRGWIHYSRGNVQEAVRDLVVSVAADSNQPDTLGLLSNCYLISGRVTHAQPFIERLLSIDPLTPLNRCLPGWANALEGDFAGAIEPYREMFEMDPGNPMARLFYTWVLSANGNEAEVQALISGFSPELLSSLPGRIAVFFADALTGKQATGWPELSPWTQKLAEANDIFPRFLGQAYALAGDADHAVHWISVAVDRGFINHPFLARHDPFLSRLTGHKPYADLLDRVHRRWESFEP
jgi:TolB-like protein